MTCATIRQQRTPIQKLLSREAAHPIEFILFVATMSQIWRDLLNWENKKLLQDILDETWLRTDVLAETCVVLRVPVVGMLLESTKHGEFCSANVNATGSRMNRSIDDARDVEDVVAELSRKTHNAS